MPDSCPYPSASTWTRLLLAALAMTVFSFAISAFLAAVLGAAGDRAGRSVFTAFSAGLHALTVAECVALIVAVAIRLEWRAAE